MIDSSIRKKCSDFKIDESRYLREFEQLTALGYSVLQANQLIIRKFSKNTILMLLKYHDALLQNFTHQDIVTIAKHGGGSKTLKR